MRAPVKPDKSSTMLAFLYHSVFGRVILKMLSSTIFSGIIGKFMDSPLSKVLIKKFVNNYNIPLDECEPAEFRCFNDFFCRKFRKDVRPVDYDDKALISPCDGFLSAYKISGGTVIPVKQSHFSIKSLFDGNKIYKEYDDGICLVFRLCVNNYHRYCYVDGGIKGDNHFVKGKLHTVRPVALAKIPVFTENCREYTVINTNNFGKIVQMEVGAMLVGKIKNYHGSQKIKRGQEKGRFLYGGSTIIVILKKNAASVPNIAFYATEKGYEIPVKLGERIGSKLN